MAVQFDVGELLFLFGLTAMALAMAEAEKPVRRSYFIGIMRAMVGVSVREKDEVAVIVRYEKNIRRTCGSVRSSLSAPA